MHKLLSIIKIIINCSNKSIKNLHYSLNSVQMYVPGTLENTKSVLVNIGTGYYAEKVSINGDLVKWLEMQL